MKISALVFMAAGAVAVATVVGCGGSGTTGGSVVSQPQAAKVSRFTTPTPTPTPIQLVLGATIGTDVFPEGDTASGGSGQQIDRINCRAFLDNQFHHHVQLSMFVNGEQIALPRGTGMKNPGHGKFIYHATCAYFLHTHDETGIIHIEPPTARTFTLKNYFDIWGEPLSTNGFAGYTGAVAVYINGTLQPGMDPNTVTFSPFEEITLVIGTPPSWIPVYLFPPGYP
ncbi:MAG TPA: hypothetical protein VID24_11565 [Candidatus Eremiobacteraceae bacterium]|jgi:hypothetical protein